MVRKTQMLDSQGQIVQVGDFVQLTEGKKPYINNAMQKGFVFKVAYIENRGTKKKPYPVAFLTGKNGGSRIYNNGCIPYEILKVNYDLKKRKIIEPVKKELQPVPSISPELAKAIDYIKKHFGHSDYESIFISHERSPNTWQFELRALNGLPIEQLRELLGQQSVDSSEGDDGMNEKITVSQQVAEALDRAKRAYSNANLLTTHKQFPNGWGGLLHPLCQLDYETLKKALQHGYEVEGEGKHVDLAPVDYESMIDFALMTGDKEWFNELLQKSNEGAIS